MTLKQTDIASGLQFPEGPIVMDDGSIVIVEIAGPRLTRILVDGTVEVIAEWDDPESAGPNGAAVGPDGHIYVCNNGGFVWSEINGMQFPMDRETGANQSNSYISGSIDRVDLATGEIVSIYNEFQGDRLCGPNDIVFDKFGGFWFTDLGKQRRREIDKGLLCSPRWIFNKAGY